MKKKKKKSSIKNINIIDKLNKMLNSLLKGGSKKELKRKKIILLLIVILSIVVIVAVRCAWSRRINTTYNGLGRAMYQTANKYNMNLFKLKNGRMTYSGSKYKGVVGIDVSAFQGNINWNKVKDDGIKFAMIRCGYRGSTEGNIVQDKYFSKNIIGANTAGIPVGIYFYSLADSTDEAIEEAAYVLEAIRDYDVTYPIAFDLEEETTKMSVEKRTDIANAFCTVIEENGYKAMVYGNQHWLATHYDMRYLTGYYTWLAHYSKKTNYKYSFRMWQYSDKGKVSGIKGNVDMDICMLKNY